MYGGAWIGDAAGNPNPLGGTGWCFVSNVTTGDFQNVDAVPLNGDFSQANADFFVARSPDTDGNPMALTGWDPCCFGERFPMTGTQGQRADQTLVGPEGDENNPHVRWIISSPVGNFVVAVATIVDGDLNFWWDQFN